MAPIAVIVRVTDPIAYAGSLLLIVAACLLAAWIPATRAARLDPMRTQAGLIAPYFFTSSTRRFLPRPSSVRLSAIGCVAP